MNGTFEEDALLKMVVQTDSIAFPPTTIGRDAIAEILVRRFNQTYENIYTLCLGEPPKESDMAYWCQWLVVMSEKASRNVRIGCGHYDWTFCQVKHSIKSLDITIAGMEILPPEALEPVMRWVKGLPYPWARLALCAQEPPNILAVHQVLKLLKE